MREYPIRVGSLLWVLTDPERGHEVEYNRWYERDHIYAGCMIGSWCFSAGRWVATRALKDLRFGRPDRLGHALDAGSYAVVYWILDGHLDEWVDWSTPQANWLYEVGRGFHQRTHVNTGIYEGAWRGYRDEDPIPLELALDHRYQGMVALWVAPAQGQDADALSTWLQAWLPANLPGSPVANMSGWRQRPLLDTAPDFVPKDEEARGGELLLAFCEDDPSSCWDRFERLGREVEKAGIGEVLLAAPFIPTEIGTDRYTDELW